MQHGRRARFADGESEQPEFAARVRAAFGAHAHKFLATLRCGRLPADQRDRDAVRGRDAGSARSDDLRRDSRFALHSGSSEPDAFSADAKLSGRANQATGDGERAAFATDTSAAR